MHAEANGSTEWYWGQFLNSNDGDLLFNGDVPKGPRTRGDTWLEVNVFRFRSVSPFENSSVASSP